MFIVTASLIPQIHLFTPVNITAPHHSSTWLSDHPLALGIIGGIPLPFSVWHQHVLTTSLVLAPTTKMYHNSTFIFYFYIFNCFLIFVSHQPSLTGTIPHHQPQAWAPAPPCQLMLHCHSASGRSNQFASIVLYLAFRLMELFCCNQLNIEIYQLW